MQTATQRGQASRPLLGILLGGAGAVFAFALFGWLRYYWAQHQIAWRSDGRYWQYVSPLIGLVVLCLLSGGIAGRRTSTRLLQSSRRIWLAGVVGAAPAAVQSALSPRGPWLLHAWMVVLTWAGRHVRRRPRVRPLEDRLDGLFHYRMTLIWRGPAPIDGDYRFGLTLGNDEVRWGPFYFASGAIPTAAWVPGRLYRDDMTLVVGADWHGRLFELRPILLR